MSDESTTAATADPPEAPAPKATKSRKRIRRSGAKSGKKTAAKLGEKLTAVLQLVTISPAPRTAAEYANQYAGLREANLWPEQSVDEVLAGIKTLVGKKQLVEGDEAPDGEPTLELASTE